MGVLSLQVRRRMGRAVALAGFVVVFFSGSADAQFGESRGPTYSKSAPFAGAYSAPYAPVWAAPWRGENVLTRFEATDPPPGYSLGGYRVTPSVQGSLTYDDNIFADDSGRQGDFITSGAVGTKLQSQFVRHALDFYGVVEGSHYLDNNSEDFWEGLVGTRGRLDIHRELQAFGDVSVRRETVPRDSPDDVNGTEPQVYLAYRGSTGLQAGTGPLIGRMEFGAERVRNDDVPSALGEIDTSDRDRDEYFGEGQVGYQYLGPQQVYLRARGFQRVYDRQFDNGGFERDSTGVRAEAGITLDLGGLVFADLSVGYQRQDFEDARFGTVQRPVGAASLLWNPTGLTSVAASFLYEFIESFNSPSPGYWRQTYAIGVAHELRRNLLATGKLLLLDRDYERLDRNDLVYGFDAGLRYRIDRGLFLEGEYRFRQQDSDIADADYYRNIAMVRLRKTF